MNFKLNLSKFKKIGGDKHTTTMQHDDGHVIKIAHKALSPENRKQMLALPVHNFDEGGKVSDKSPVIDPKKVGGDVTTSKPEGFSYVKNLKDGLGLADGGEVPDSKQKYAEKHASNLDQDTQESIIHPGMFDDAAKAAVQGFAASVAPGEAPIARSAAWLAEKGAPQVIENAVAQGKGYLGKAVAQRPYPFNQTAETIAAGLPKKFADGGSVGGDAEERLGRESMEQTSKDMTESQKAVMKADQADREALRSTKFADGGEVPPTDQPPQQQPTIIINNGPQPQNGGQPPQPQSEPMSLGLDQAQQGLPQPEQQQAPQPSMAPQQQAQAPAPQQAPQDPFGAQSQGNAYMRGLGEQLRGVGQQANATGAAGNEQAAAYDNQVRKQQDIQQQVAQVSNQYAKDRADLMHDIQNNHITPENYWKDHSKLMTGLGILLAGFNPTNSPNAAIDFLHRQMQMNLESQKAEMDKKHNLLSALHQQYGDKMTALNMFNVMQRDILGDQIKQVASKYANPQAQALALQMQGQLNKESAGMVGQTVMRTSLLNGANNGSISPAKIVNFLIPEHQRSDANKELKEMLDTSDFKDRLLNAFDKLNSIDTVGNRIMHAGFTPPEVKAIREPLLAELSKGTAGKFTEADSAMLAPLLSPSGKGANTVATQREQLLSLISGKMHAPILEAYGIDPHKLGKFGSTGQSRIPESAPVLNKR